jgi:ribose-phosphate pyrophosphokinase
MAETLNLVNPNDILSFKYEISRFPDGQQSLRLIEDGYNTFKSLRDSDSAHGIIIESRLNTFSDLEIIICATQALKEVGVKNISLYIPYCIGARSDRKFMEGGINYVKHVIAPIINSQGYNKVTILDPHSDVLEACINNFEKQDNINLVTFALKDYFLSKGFETWSASNFDGMRFISPDAGALKKVFHVAETFGYKGEIIIASKHRNLETGMIDYTNVPISANDADKDVFIIDDICDGGRTFIEIAKAINKFRIVASSIHPIHPDNHGKNYLIVTHGIFSAGFDLLAEYFDGIYCTNSVKDIQDGIIVNTFSRHKTIHSLVKQQNVF